MRLLFAAAIAVAAAAGAFQTNAPALSHAHADVNGVKLHVTPLLPESLGQR